MNKRLQQFIAAENLSQSQFADAIGVARASVSHILAGRNKPGFDFIVNMSSHYPTLNLEWLINGKGRMYKSDNNSPTVQTCPDIAADKSADFDEPKTDGIPSDGLFGASAFSSPEPQQINEPPMQGAPLPFQGQAPQSLQGASMPPAAEPQPQFRDSIPAAAGAYAAPVTAQPLRSIEKIIVFYSDNTFQELK